MEKLLISGANVFINSSEFRPLPHTHYAATLQSNQPIEKGDKIVGRGFFTDNITMYTVEAVAQTKPSKVEGYNTSSVILSWSYVKADTMSVIKIGELDSKLARAITTAIKSVRI